MSYLLYGFLYLLLLNSLINLLSIVNLPKEIVVENLQNTLDIQKVCSTLKSYSIPFDR